MVERNVNRIYKTCKCLGSSVGISKSYQHKVMIEESLSLAFQYVYQGDS
jgi:hypothetical protein